MMWWPFLCSTSTLVVLMNTKKWSDIDEVEQNIVIVQTVDSIVFLQNKSKIIWRRIWPKHLKAKCLFSDGGLYLFGKKDLRKNFDHFFQTNFCHFVWSVDHYSDQMFKSWRVTINDPLDDSQQTVIWFIEEEIIDWLKLWRKIPSVTW